MRILFLSEGKYAHPELGKRLVRVNMRSGEGKYAQCLPNGSPAER